MARVVPVLLCMTILVASPPPASADTADLELLEAVRQGREDEVRRLLDAGADVNFRDDHGRTALQVAAREGHAAIANVLVSNGASVSIPDANGSSALLYAATNGHAEILRLLLDGGANVNARNADGGTALHKAALSLSTLMRFASCWTLAQT